MAKIKKKGTSGQAKNFITRTQAVRKLQISLPDFRRLCIFKGIYPREPRNKKKVSKSSTPSTTFYYTKDIQYLVHEPLLAKFRAHKALAKKISKALGRGEVTDAARLEKNLLPRLPLDHIIRERYPTFDDALRDLDDALSMLFLFANLPSTTSVPPKTIARCQRLCLEFQHYLIVARALRKSFLSVKGIYYQATVQGQDVMWLVPYRFVQRVDGDVDFRIMGTFVEFYSTLLGFVNFRLYTSVGLVYPPKFDATSDERGGELRAMTIQGKAIGVEGTRLISQAAGAPDDGTTTNGVRGGAETETRTHPQQSKEQLETVVRQIAASEEQQQPEQEPGQEESNNYQTSEAIDVFEAPISADADILPQPSMSTTETASLFAPFAFFLSRETPRQPLEFLLRAFGCTRIGWDAVLGDGAFTTDEADPAITHQVVDRPPMPVDVEDTEGEESPVPPRRAPNSRYPGRTYIQPQWVWDCVNAGKLLRPDLYAPGAELPPHLSPWVKPSKGQYDPTLPLEEQEREGEAEEEEDEVEEDGAERRNEASRRLEVDHVTADDEDGGMDVANDETSEEEEEDGDDDDEIVNKEQKQEQDEAEWEGFSADDEDKGKAMPAPSKDQATVEEDTDDVDADEEVKADDADEGVEEDDADEMQHQRELEAEMAGIPVSSMTTKAASTTKTTTAGISEQRKKAAANKKRQAEEELERQKMMMSGKKRKTLEKMLYSNRKKDDEAANLRRKRRRIERERKVVA
ncbi:MAG: mRNA-binding ribosome synthesis protein nop7 [Peltula sp. TS41687]|nr:MAG: mRNA-binding ribosome synthesis protein nop7 [Peltula sp. TS41687]